MSMSIRAQKIEDLKPEKENSGKSIDEENSLDQLDS